MLQKLKQWTIKKLESKQAEWWLTFIAFIESMFFPIPADILFVPLCLLKTHSPYKLAIMATIGSCLGSLCGYILGYIGYTEIILPLLETLGKVEKFESYRQILQSDIYLLWGMLLSSGFTHIPPIKVVTIMSGVAGVSFFVFMVSAFISRAARFFLLAWLLKQYGEEIVSFIQKRFLYICILGIIGLAAIYLTIKA